MGTTFLSASSLIGPGLITFPGSADRWLLDMRRWTAQRRQLHVPINPPSSHHTFTIHPYILFVVFLTTSLCGRCYRWPTADIARSSSHGQGVRAMGVASTPCQACSSAVSLQHRWRRMLEYIVNRLTPRIYQCGAALRKGSPRQLYFRLRVQVVISPTARRRNRPSLSALTLLHLASAWCLTWTSAAYPVTLR